MKSLCLLLCYLSFAFKSFALPQVGVRAQSFGGAYRALSSSNDAIFYNPAGIIKRRSFSADLDYLKEAQAKAHSTGLSLVDSQSGAWGLGLAYNGRFVVDHKIPNTHVVYLASAMPIVSDMFVLGTTMHYTHDRGLGPEPFANYFNMNMGFLADLPVGLSFAAVLDNLLKAKGNEKKMGFALAAAFNLGELLPIVPLTLSFDWLMDDVTSETKLHHVVMTGFEYVLLSLIPLRVGYNADLSLKKKVISLGCGVESKVIALDILYQQNLSLGAARNFGLAVRFSI